MNYPLVSKIFAKFCNAEAADEEQVRNVIVFRIIMKLNALVICWYSIDPQS